MDDVKMFELMVMKVLEIQNDILVERKKEDKLLVYGTKELSEAMGMSINYANKLMNYPGFPSTKIGGSWKVSKKALEEWLDHNKYHNINIDVA